MQRRGCFRAWKQSLHRLQVCDLKSDFRDSEEALHLTRISKVTCQGNLLCSLQQDYIPLFHSSGYMRTCILLILCLWHPVSFRSNFMVLIPLAAVKRGPKLENKMVLQSCYSKLFNSSLKGVVFWSLLLKRRLPYSNRRQLFYRFSKPLRSLSLSWGIFWVYGDICTKKNFQNCI